MSPLAGANLALRFALELAALAAVGIWGLEAGDGVAGWALALLAVVVFAAVWGLVVSPKARVDWPQAARFAVELALWAVAGAALADAVDPALGAGFVGVAVASGALNYREVSSAHRRRRS